MESDDLLRETYKLAKENNKMLHAMRREAFLGRFFKLLLYAAIIVTSLWIYLSYVAPLLDQMLKALSQIQAAGSQAQNQMSDWQQAIDSLRSRIPGLSSESSR